MADYSQINNTTIIIGTSAVSCDNTLLPYIDVNTSNYNSTTTTLPL